MKFFVLYTKVAAEPIDHNIGWIWCWEDSFGEACAEIPDSNDNS